MKLEIYTYLDDDEVKLHANADGLDKVSAEELTAMITELEIQKLWLISYYDKNFHHDKKEKIKLV